MRRSSHRGWVLGLVALGFTSALFAGPAEVPAPAPESVQVAELVATPLASPSEPVAEGLEGALLLAPWYCCNLATSRCTLLNPTVCASGGGLPAASLATCLAFCE